MVKKVSKELKRTFFLNFIVSLVFGVLLFFMPNIYLGWFGISYPPFPPFPPFVFGGLFGGALLAFASASFFAWKETEWEKVKIIMIMHIVWNMFGAFVFFWAVIYLSPDPRFYLAYKIMNLIYLIVFFAFLAAFIYYYAKHEKEQPTARDDVEPVTVISDKAE